MNYEIKHKKGEEQILLPKDRVLELLPEFSEAELKVLIALTAESDPEKARELCSLDSGEFSEALSFLRGAKLIGRQSTKKRLCTDEQQSKTEQKASEPVRTEIPIDTDGIPEYKSSDVVRVCGQDPLFRSILDEAQQTYGKVFNNVEHNYIIAMREHLALDGEYILMLLEYFKREGKPLCYAVRVADTLVKRGICDPEALEQYLKHRDAFKGSEGRYRELFGIGTRALTAHEERYFTSWSEQMQMPFELVTVAFERTVEKKGTPQKSYINGILKSWHSQGIRSEEQLYEYESKQRDKKASLSASGKKSEGAFSGKTGESTFDIDDFFAAALERTYSQDGKKE